MASAQRVTYFKARIEDKPGTLLALLKDLKAKNLGLGGLRASPGEPGWANLYVIPKNPEKVRNFWKGGTILAEEGTAFFVKGTDKTGALVKMLDAVGQAGVNLIETDAVAVGGKYGTFFLVAPGDVDKMAKAIGAK
jgi:prephenate dehydratase